jgi:hypothetical protein
LPAADERGAAARLAQRDARAAHERADGFRRLAGEQLDVVEADAALPVQVLDQRGGERHRAGEPHGDRSAWRHPRHVVHGQHRVDERVGVQRADQFDLLESRQRDNPADADGQPEGVGAAQHRVG